MREYWIGSKGPGTGRRTDHGLPERRNALLRLESSSHRRRLWWTGRSGNLGRCARSEGDRQCRAVAHRSHNWGFLQYTVDGLDAEKAIIWLREGGWQINLTGPRGEFGLADPLGMRSRLLLYPPDGVDLAKADVHIAVDENAVALEGTEFDPVKHVHIASLRFAHTAPGGVRLP